MLLRKQLTTNIRSVKYTQTLLTIYCAKGLPVNLSSCIYILHLILSVFSGGVQKQLKALWTLTTVTSKGNCKNRLGAAMYFCP